MKKNHLLSILVILLSGMLAIQCSQIQQVENDLQNAIKNLNKTKLGIDIASIKDKAYNELSVKLSQDVFLEMDNIQTLSAKGVPINQRLAAVTGRFIVITDSDTLSYEIEVDVNNQDPSLNDGIDQFVYIEATDTTLLRSNLADQVVINVTNRSIGLGGIKEISLAGGKVLKIGNLPTTTHLELDAAYIGKPKNSVTPIEQ